jgi:hypothetical protein
MTANRIAVVGSGPRGMMVVERLVARATEPVEIHFIDAVEVGAGRVYRTDQPEWFLMNTVAGQISAFSGLPDDGPARAGAGPSFVEWWTSVDPDCPGFDSYASRAHYGRYLRFVLDAIEANLPPVVELHREHTRVDELVRTADGYRLALADGRDLEVGRVVLTTGHSVPELTGQQKVLADFAAEQPDLRHIRGDSAADMPLSDIAPGTPVGVLGLGLSFYDVLAAFTIGRGGRFEDAGEGRLTYVPSGLEPVLVAGSRSGMPLPARGHNQKPPTYSYKPVLFTPDRVRRGLPEGPLDFRADVLPWLLAEVHLVFYATSIRHRFGVDAAKAFTDEVALAGVPDVVEIAGRHGVGDLPPIDLDALARPFGGRTFPDRHAFERELTTALHRDLEHAVQGNVDSPLKAGLDVLRDTRWVIRKLVDFSGLHPVSHRTDFLGWYVPRSAFLAAGPPQVRLRQVLALIEAGLLRIVGPDAAFDTDQRSGRFVVSSPQVADSAVPVEVVIDARIPYPDLRHDLGPLTRSLREQGIWTEYVNRAGDDAFDTGGVAVTGSPFHPVDQDGRVDTGLYVLGIPTEHTRWFMQVGSSRPGQWSDFVHDADDIAGHALSATASLSKEAAA